MQLIGFKFWDKVVLAGFLGLAGVTSAIGPPQTNAPPKYVTQQLEDAIHNCPLVKNICQICEGSSCSSVGIACTPYERRCTSAENQTQKLE
jgi:hypothetical protein